MKRHQRKSKNYYSLYSEATEPALPSITLPLPASTLPQQSWVGRVLRGVGLFFVAIINKINQLLAFALSVLVLLLFTRFILFFFHLTLSQFSYWVFYLSTPLISPFDKLLPPLPYNGYTVDVTTLIAILVYALAVTIVRQFLKVLVKKPL